MVIDIDNVEAVLSQYLQIPQDLSPAALHDLAFRIQVLAGPKYTHDNLKYQLHCAHATDLAAVPRYP
jgi:hypothetical protein